jgi:hypothetical protein
MPPPPSTGKKVIRATDAKEVGVENPSEETLCRPNQKCVLSNMTKYQPLVNLLIIHNQICPPIFHRDKFRFIRIIPRTEVDPFV